MLCQGDKRQVLISYHISVSFEISRRFSEILVLLSHHLEKIELDQMLAVVSDQMTTSASTNRAKYKRSLLSLLHQTLDMSLLYWLQRDKEAASTGVDLEWVDLEDKTT